MCAGSWEQRWQKSSWKQSEGSAGEFKQTAGKWYGDEKGKHLVMMLFCYVAGLDVSWTMLLVQTQASIWQLKLLCDRDCGCVVTYCADKGIQTGPDSKYFALYSELKKPFTNDGKELVLQFQVKHEQDLDCGGGYIKLLPGSRCVLLSV
jgi:calreticulin